LFQALRRTTITVCDVRRARAEGTPEKSNKRAGRLGALSVLRLCGSDFFQRRADACLQFYGLGFVDNLGFEQKT
jgi:hypothetical protein